MEQIETEVVVEDEIGLLVTRVLLLTTDEDADDEIDGEDDV